MRKLCRRIHWKSALPQLLFWISSKKVSNWLWKEIQKIRFLTRYGYISSSTCKSVYSNRIPSKNFQTPFLRPFLSCNVRNASLSFFASKWTWTVSSLFNVCNNRTFQGKGHMINCFLPKATIAANKTKSCWEKIIKKHLSNVFDPLLKNNFHTYSKFKAF